MRILLPNGIKNDQAALEMKRTLENIFMEINFYLIIEETPWELVAHLLLNGGKGGYVFDFSMYEEKSKTFLAIGGTPTGNYLPVQDFFLEGGAVNLAVLAQIIENAGVAFDVRAADT